MRTTDGIRQILESRKCTVDIVCEPHIFSGFVSYHLTGQPSKRAIIKVFERMVCSHEALVDRVARSIREMKTETERERECQKENSDETGPSSTKPPD